MKFSQRVAASLNITGMAFVNMLVTDQNGVYNCQMYDVMFEPVCRNTWHIHAGGQILLCTDGVGYYQEKGKAARRLVRGDVGEIPPEVEHWHGAAPDCSFTHIGISPNTDKGAATWLSPVTDEEYMQTTGGNDVSV